METFLLLTGCICVIVGILGCILPLLPGLPLCYLGVLLLHFSAPVDFSYTFLITWALLIILIQLLDYYIPVWGTKKFGGGRCGAWGSAFGVVLGLFFAPWGLIVGPFVGAVIGELIDNKDIRSAFRAGFGSFIGFLAGSLIKLVASILLAYYFFKNAILSIESFF